MHSLIVLYELSRKAMRRTFRPYIIFFEYSILDLLCLEIKLYIFNRAFFYCMFNIRFQYRSSSIFFFSYLHVITADIFGGHNSGERKSEYGDEAGNSERNDLCAPVSRHYNHHITTCGSLFENQAHNNLIWM